MLKVIMQSFGFWKDVSEEEGPQETQGIERKMKCGTILPNCSIPNVGVDHGTIQE